MALQSNETCPDAYAHINLHGNFLFSVPLTAFHKGFRLEGFRGIPVFDHNSDVLKGYSDVLKGYSDVLKGYSDVLRT